MHFRRRYDLAFFGVEILLALFSRSDLAVFLRSNLVFFCVGIVLVVLWSSLQHDSPSLRHPCEEECQSGHEDFPGTPTWTPDRTQT